MNIDKLAGAVTTAQSYTTIVSPTPGSDAANAALIPATPKLNFSGHAVTSGPPADFTVAGWVRVVAPPQGTRREKIFWADGQFGLALSSDGKLHVWFGSFGQPSDVIGTETGIVDNQWHYVAVSCAHQPDNKSCDIAISLDGMVLADGVVPIPPTPETTEHYYLGTGALEYAAWTMWSTYSDMHEMQVPEFGPPVVNTPEDVDLVAAFNFAAGPAQDLSPNKLPITAYPGPTYWPRLELGTGSLITPDPEDQVTLFGPASAMMMWVKLPSDANELQLNLARAAGNTIWLSDSNGTLMFAFNGAGSFLTGGTPGDYVHLAVSLRTDANNFVVPAIYINGQQVWDGGGVLAGPVAAAPVTLLDNQQAAASFVQGLTVWNRELSEAEIIADMEGQGFDNVDGLLAYYPFQTDAKNAVTGRPAALKNAELVGQVQEPAMASALIEALGEAPMSAPDCDRLIHFPQMSDIHRLAEKHDIALAATDPATALPPCYDRTLAEIGGLSELSALQQAGIVDSIRIGHELWQAGVKIGTIEHFAEGGQTVFVYHAEEGPIELMRLDFLLDPVVSWTITIITDIIAILGAAFGITTDPGKLANGVRLVMAALPTMRNALLDGLKGGEVSASAAVFGVVREIFTAGLLLPLIKALVSGSWWSLVFTALSLLGQIVLCVLSGGAALAVKLALAAIAVAKLIYDLTQYPR